jgi:hypothetical protein
MNAFNPRNFYLTTDCTEDTGNARIASNKQIREFIL